MSKQEQQNDLPKNGGNDDDEEYPPWLQHIVEGEYYNVVKVVEEEDLQDDSQPGYVRCKAIRVPDAADAAEAAERADVADVRIYHVKTHSVVMIIAEPDSAPYIGLVEKIWRDKSKQPLDGSEDTYTTSDFMLECYWFYRPDEVPETAWDGMSKRKEMKGAQFAFSKRGKPHLERRSPRQLLFSSHHTKHDYPDNNGLLSLEGFLQACEPVHWIGLKDLPPIKYRIHGGKLTKVLAPGFVVQGFLWCNGKNEAQLDSHFKRAYGLDQDWGDAGTMTIVHEMVQKSKNRLARLSQRNEEIVNKYVQHAKRKELGLAVSALRSESGGLDESEQVQQQACELRGIDMPRHRACQQPQGFQPPSCGQATGSSDGHDSDEDVPLIILGQSKRNSVSPGAGVSRGPVVATQKVSTTSHRARLSEMHSVNGAIAKNDKNVRVKADRKLDGAGGDIGEHLVATTAAISCIQRNGGEFGSDDDDD